jgi:hypothetical protein
MERVVADLVVRAHRVNGLPRSPERAAMQIALSAVLAIVSASVFAFISEMRPPGPGGVAARAQV